MNTTYRTKSASQWMTTIEGGEVITTRAQFYGETVYVTVTLPDGTEVERRGRMTVHRTMRFDGGAVLHPIVDVEVASILGEVTVHGRSKIKAAEAYGSMVAQAVVEQWKRSPSGAHHRGEHDFNESQFEDVCPICKEAVS